MNQLVVDQAAINQSFRYDGVRAFPSDLGVHSQTLTQRFAYGSRCVMADGRVFKYGRAKTALLGGYGAANVFPTNKHVTYAVLATAAAVGDTQLTVTYPSTSGYANVGFAKDELNGGYLVVGHNAANVENFQIVGNDAI